MVGRKLGQNTSSFRNRQGLAENTRKGLKPRTDKWDCLKLKSFYAVKETIKGRDSLQNEKKFCWLYILQKRLIFKVYRELKKSMESVMAQCVRAPAATPEYLSLIPLAHTVEG